MRAGELTDRFRFDQDTGASDDGSGQHVEAADAVCTRRALFARGAEGDRFSRLRTKYPTLTDAIAVRYDSVTVTLRPPLRATSLIHAGRVFSVLGPPLDPDDRRRELQLAVVERFPIETANL
jgi:hypothetical protein